MEDFITAYRPSTFNGVMGNHDIKSTVRGWVTKGIYPRAIVLVGRCGIGKTTLGKLIAERFFCCTVSSQELEPCGVCTTCSDSSLHPKEIDLTNYSVEEVRYHLKNAINLFNPRVALYFDEMQRWNVKNQEIFLKPIEEAEDVHFIFSTTDVKAIEKGILSRAVILQVYPPKADEMVAWLMPIARENDIRAGEAAIRKLIKMTNSTPRICLKALNVFATMEEEITEEVLERDFIRRMIIAE